MTTVLLNASLGSEQYQSMKSRMPWSYERLELADVKLFKTADFDCSRSGSFKTAFGVRLRLSFAISVVCTIGRCATPVIARQQYAAFLIPNPCGGQGSSAAIPEGQRIPGADSRSYIARTPNGDFITANRDGSNADPNQPSELIAVLIRLHRRGHTGPQCARSRAGPITRQRLSA